MLFDDEPAQLLLVRTLLVQCAELAQLVAIYFSEVVEERVLVLQLLSMQPDLPPHVLPRFLFLYSGTRAVRVIGLRLQQCSIGWLQRTRRLILGQVSAGQAHRDLAHDVFALPGVGGFNTEIGPLANGF